MINTLTKPSAGWKQKERDGKNSSNAEPIDTPASVQALIDGLNEKKRN